MERSSGIIMHIASLPGKYGIGTLGNAAYRFVDFLQKSGQRYWQILPLGPTGFGDSPYQSFSAFAGNPYFIDFNILKEKGLLKHSDFADINFGEQEDKIDYSLIFTEKMKILRKAYLNFKLKSEADSRYKDFKKKNSFWLKDYSLYMSVKEKFNLKSWHEWDDDIKFRESKAVSRYEEELNDEIEFWNFIQYEFFEEWEPL